jgi:beta-N-acetylhexosaminidase
MNTPEISLHDQIGQMLIIGFNGTEIDDTSPIVKAMAQSNIGGVILFDIDYHSKTTKNIKNPQS